MPLSGRLLYVEMTFSCPSCRTPIVKSGGWFQTIKRFDCASCGSNIHITYDDKVALFEKHAHLTPCVNAT